MCKVADYCLETAAEKVDSGHRSEPLIHAEARKEQKIAKAKVVDGAPRTKDVPRRKETRALLCPATFKQIEVLNL